MMSSTLPAVNVSDLTWTSATNGWGPVEKNMSNGETAAGDGHTLTLNGKTYATGLGVHALSQVTYNIAGKYTNFTSDIGVDDEVGSKGSVDFQIFGDGVKLYDSGKMTGSSTTKRVNVNVAGKNTLQLVVTNAGDGNSYDHADWAGAQLLPQQTTTTTATTSSIWNSTTVPASTPVYDSTSASQGVELGMKFRSDTAGTITGLQFYKNSNNTGTHTGHLWSSSGQLLASVTFSGETATGWQKATFSSPVAIQANTTYIVSYHTNAGYYADDQNYFASTGVNNGSLHALANGTDGANGVYAYGSAAFPTSSWQSSNYYVDVMFTPSTSSPTPTPTTTVPAAPSSLTATATSSSQINMTWTDNATNESGFVIQRKTGSAGTWAQIATVGSNVTSYSNTGLTASTQYYYRVLATNTAGNSAFSNEANATTQAVVASTAQPGPSNTGPTDPTILKASGSITVNQDGAIIENVDVTGNILVNASNVTIRNFRVNATGSYYGITVSPGATNVLIEDGELTGASEAMLNGPNFTALRLNIHHGMSDGIKPEANVTIDSCWIHQLGMAAGAHADAVQSLGTNNLVIRNNFFDVPEYTDSTGQTFLSNSCIYLTTYFGGIDNVTIENNWLNGGGYTLGIGDGGAGHGNPTNVKILNNKFGRGYEYGIRNFNSSGTVPSWVTWSGNTWADNGQTIL